MTKKHKTKKLDDLNPLLAMTGVLIITGVMVAITTVVFLHSSAHTTVKQIQLGIEASNLIEQDDIDITSPINATDIDEYHTSINQRLNAIDDQEDFGPEAVSDKALGL